MSKFKLCPECFEEHPVERMEGEVIHEIRGEKFKNKVKKLICTNCEEENTPDDEYDESLLEAFNKYRKKQDMLLPREIKEIREKYGFTSQRSFARVLDWGEITIHRYEKGALQDTVHDDLLQSLREPKIMKDILEKHKENLKPKQYQKSMDIINKLIQENGFKEALIEKYRSYSEEFTGNQNFNLKKAAHMALYFAENITNLWKTKLIKLIWYSEFYNYKKTKLSIAGTPFIHYDYGPLPPDYQTLLSVIEQNEKTIKIEKIIDIQFEGEVISAYGEFDKSIFSNEEIETLDLICDSLKRYSSRDLVNKTHGEKAYKETKYLDLIPYNFANDINL